ncbi:ParB/RepB/Spo0J family partition protein [Aneurinibacillus aneurinilyticus]|uniref:ParB/RepB/Spo0J family partition protein n=1 Tax=Aneurinibacillus aneurinilyticus TaxID=1391 RepID=UPI00366F47A9
MAGVISIEKLNPHPKNGYYFTDIEGEKYEEIKRSINLQGIRDPLKVTTGYTVISGHQRLRIAKDIGLTEVPVDINDINEWDAEYLLIAENVERRGEAEPDPIKKARIAQFLKEYWGVKQGKKGQNVPIKTTADVAEVIGEDVRTTKRLLKLNDLIPEIQALVSSGNLGTTAAEQIAYLTPDEQRLLLTIRGEDVVGATSVVEAKGIREQAKESRTTGESFEAVLQRADEAERKASEFERQASDIKRKASELERENERLLMELEGAQAKTEVVEKVVEKPVYHVPDDVKRELSESKARLSKAESERGKLEAALAEQYGRIRELEQLERSVRSQQESPLYDIYRASAALNGYLKAFIENDRLARDVLSHADRGVLDKLLSELRSTVTLADKLTQMSDDETSVVIIDGEQNNYLEVI